MAICFIILIILQMDLRKRKFEASKYDLFLTKRKICLRSVAPNAHAKSVVFRTGVSMRIGPL